MNRGANYYSEGRYIDAAQLFEHTEGELRSYDVAQRARYGLYRGATLLQLGDMNEAQRWLLFGYQLAAKDAGALSPSERVALREALSSARARQATGHDGEPLLPPALSPASDASPGEVTPAGALPGAARF